MRPTRSVTVHSWGRAGNDSPARPNPTHPFRARRIGATRPRRENGRGKRQYRALLTARASDVRPVALLELLPRAARARIVASDGRPVDVFRHAVARRS